MMRASRWMLTLAGMALLLGVAAVGILWPLLAQRETVVLPLRISEAGQGLFLGARHLAAGAGIDSEDVRAWDGTEVDGALRADPAGHLVLDPAVRRTFDYFLLATGEMPLTSIDLLMREHIADELQEPAAGEARSLWQRYVQCRDAMAAVVPPEGPTGLRDRLMLVRALQEHHFNRAELSALFSEDNADDVRAAEQLEMLADESLSDEERQVHLQNWLDSLAPDRREARDESLRAVIR